MKLEIEDCEARHAEAPATFEIPDLALRTGLKQGQFAKLIFKSASPGSGKVNAERMWVKVTEITGTGDKVAYKGTLNNQPAFAGIKEHIQLHDEVAFEPRHIAMVWSNTDEDK